MKKIKGSVGGGISSTVMLPFRLLLDGHRDFELITALLPNEHPDVFKLENEVSRLLGIPIKNVGVWNPGDVVTKDPIWTFLESGMLGNSMFDPCSRMLKREPIKKWVLANCSPDDTILALGITGNEIDRTLSIMRNWKETGFETMFPLVDMYWSRKEQIDFCYSVVGFVPELYLMGFAHNNCHGACIKAGLRQWAKLLWFMPDVYKQWELGEIEWQNKYQKSHTILKRTVHSKKVYVSLKELREELEWEWKGIIKGLEPYQKIEGYESLNLEHLDDTPGCSFCDAMAFSQLD